MSPASSERFLVTGALGCIGAWTLRTLIRDGVPVVAFDLPVEPRRLRQLLTPAELADLALVSGDITNAEAIGAALDAHEITNVIHLAALQVPFCRADPAAGARVNVLGTINVFEAVRQRQERLAPLVYASSIAVFDAGDADPATGRLRTDATPHPRTHYGAYKLANEGNARVYWLDGGISSIGVRPMTVYGVGRDQGMTSGPTRAIAAAVLGRRYRVPFGGATVYQYAEDVARTLIAASRAGLSGAHVFNLPGRRLDMREVIRAIDDVIEGARDLIEFDDVELPFPSRIDHDGIEAIGDVPVTPFADGVRASVEIYRHLDRLGRLVATEQGLEAQPDGSR
jgi:nucleoside-diphosphate-sugar epimerase